MEELFDGLLDISRLDAGAVRVAAVPLADLFERLARLLGHEVELRSRVGKGSMFAVMVPRATRDDDQS